MVGGLPMENSMSELADHAGRGKREPRYHEPVAASTGALSFMDCIHCCEPMGPG